MNINNISLTSGVLAVLVSSALVGCGSSKTTTPTTTPELTPLQQQIVAALPQSTEVFGIGIRATSATPADKILHAANVMAKYLDNNEDGVADNKDVVAKMVEKNATLVIAQTEDELSAALAGVSMTEESAIQDLYGSEIHLPDSTSGQFDATFEEVLHLITHEGYAAVYPEVFGEKIDSEIADAMDIARGDRFTSIPASYPSGAWYTYDDESCEYDCMVTEYTYWALTSILGAQQGAGRLAQISHEWQLNTKVKVELQDPVIYNILTDPSYALATQLPDGKYQPKKFIISVDAKNPSGNVADANKAQAFDYITEQSEQSIAVYGSKSIEQAAYDRALADIRQIVSTLDTDVRQGLFNAGVKMLIVSDEAELEDNIDYFQSLLPVEAIYTNIEGVDETLTSAENGGLSTTKLELMYLVVYYSLLTEDKLAPVYTALKAAYEQATSANIFSPSEAYRDGYVDEIHQNASDQNALKYGSYLFNLTKLYFGDDTAPAGEFTITTRAQLQSENLLGFQMMQQLFPAG